MFTAISIYTILFQLLALKSSFALPLTSKHLESSQSANNSTAPTSMNTGKSFYAGGLVGVLGTIALGTGIFTSRYSDMQLQIQRQEQVHAIEREKWKRQMNAPQTETVSKHLDNVSLAVSLPSYASTGVQHTPAYTSSSTETTLEFNPEGAQEEKLALEEQLRTTVSELEKAQVKSQEYLDMFNAKWNENGQNIDEYNVLVNRFNALVKTDTKNVEDYRALSQKYNALLEKYDKTWF